MFINSAFDLINIFLILTGICNAFLGFLIFTKSGRSLTNKIYILNIIFIIWWITGMFAYRTFSENLIEWTQFLYIAPTGIASTFLYFTYFFPTQEKNRLGLGKKILIGAPNLFIVFLILIPGVIIKNVIFHPDGSESIIIFGEYYWLYAVYIMSYFSLGLMRLFYKMQHSENKIEKRQILLLLIGYLIASNSAMVTNLILPWFGYFTLNWIGQIFTIFMVSSVAYAIFKYNLFSTKVIATELLAGGLWITIFVQFLSAESLKAQITQGIVLSVVTLLGIFLVRSVLKEVEQREQLEFVTHELQVANEELRKLDEQKSDFITIASHQLRTPLTIIRGYISLLIEGSFGKLTEAFTEPVNRIRLSNDRLINLVNDLLNLSRIERGKMTYVFERSSLLQVVQDVYIEMQEAAKQKKIGLNFTEPKDKMPDVLMDPKKIKEVVINFVDNALAYTKQGSITLSLEHISSSKVLRVSVKDTGIGIAKEDIPGLFKKFSRMEDAKRISSEGTGLGLYVAKLIIEDHKGRIWVESQGRGLGSTFIFELPTLS